EGGVLNVIRTARQRLAGAAHSRIALNHILACLDSANLCGICRGRRIPGLLASDRVRRRCEVLCRQERRLGRAAHRFYRYAEESVKTGKCSANVAEIKYYRK